jgi:hypothetical protein
VNPDLVASIVTALVSLILGVLSFLSATHAHHQPAGGDPAPEAPDPGPGAEVLGDAYGRAVGLYERALAECEREADRLRHRIAQLEERRGAPPA